MEEIIALTIEDPCVREILKARETIDHRLSKMKESTVMDPQICKWASTSFYALENENIHDLGSKVILGGQDAASDRDKLADLARCVICNEEASFLSRSYKANS